MCLTQPNGHAPEGTLDNKKARGISTRALENHFKILWLSRYGMFNVPL